MESTRIFLVGMMGSGKSTVGLILAELLHLEFIDLDKAIEDEVGMPIYKIFIEKGEEAFRKMEAAKLSAFIEKSGYVLATGGGTYCQDGLHEVMNKSGATVYLKCSPSVLFDRLRLNLDNRPLLKGKENPFDSMVQILESRGKFYSRAEIVIQSDNASPKEIAEMILFELTRQGRSID